MVGAPVAAERLCNLPENMRLAPDAGEAQTTDVRQSSVSRFGGTAEQVQAAVVSGVVGFNR